MVTTKVALRNDPASGCPVEEATQHPEATFPKETLDGKVVTSIILWATAMTFPLGC